MSQSRITVLPLARRPVFPLRVITLCASETTHSTEPTSSLPNTRRRRRKRKCGVCVATPHFVVHKKDLVASRSPFPVALILTRPVSTCLTYSRACAHCQLCSPVRHSTQHHFDINASHLNPAFQCQCKRKYWQLQGYKHTSETSGPSHRNQQSRLHPKPCFSLHSSLGLSLSTEARAHNTTRQQHIDFPLEDLSMQLLQYVGILSLFLVYLRHSGDNATFNAPS